MKLTSCFKKMLKSKKGIAIESAIATSIVVFSLCSILLMTAIFSAQTRENISEDFKDRTRACEIAESYVAWLNDTSADKGEFSCSALDPDGLYTVELDMHRTDGEHSIRISKDATPLLTVELDGSVGSYTVILWRYGNYMN